MQKIPVLHVEDDLSIRQALKTYVNTQHKNIEVVALANAQEAIEMLLEKEFDVGIFDILYCSDSFEDIMKRTLRDVVLPPVVIFNPGNTTDDPQKTLDRYTEILKNFGHIVKTMHKPTSFDKIVAFIQEQCTENA